MFEISDAFCYNSRMKIREMTASAGRKIGIFFELVKFEHTIFALPFAFIGALIGGSGSIPADKIVFILLAMVGARTAGMALNRIIDRDIDAKNPRTSTRAIPRGAIGTAAVWAIIAVSLALFLFAAFSLNETCFKLSPVCMFFLFLYSYTKRFTSLSHFVLGFILAIAPAGGYLAVRPVLEAPWILLSASVLTWVAGFDIIYSCQDIEFDRKENLYSIPAKAGAQKALFLSRVLHAFTVAGLVTLGRLIAAGPWYYAAAAACISLLAYEHSLLRGGNLENVDVAFFNVNGYVAVIMLAGTLLNYYL